MKKNAFLLLVILLFLTAPGRAAEISGSARINAVGKYLWRGVVLYDGLAVQPEVKLDLNKFELIYWASYDGIEGGSHKLEESDIWVSFEDALPFAEVVLINAGFITYLYHYAATGNDLSIEIFAGASLDTFLEPYLTFYYDTMLGNGSYLEAGISHSVELKPFEINGSLSVGYNFSQYVADFDVFKPSFTAALLNIGLTYDIADSGIKITPAFIGQLALSDIYESAVTWSVSFNYDFSITGGEEKKEEVKKEE